VSWLIVVALHQLPQIVNCIPRLKGLASNSRGTILCRASLFVFPMRESCISRNGPSSNSDCQNCENIQKSGVYELYRAK